jgi:hypothetical protein
MGGTTVLTGGLRLPERERRERERVESLTGGAGLSEEARAREAGPPGPGREGVESAGAARVGQNWPSRGGKGFFFFFFYFLFPFSLFLFLFVFISFSFESTIF